MKNQAFGNGSSFIKKQIGHYLDLGSKATRILFSEGPGALWFRYNQYRISRISSPALPDSDLQPPQSDTGNTTIRYSLENFNLARLSSFLRQNGSRLTFPVYNEPLVSIITPVFNKAAITYPYLESLLANTSIAYELIVIDNNSTDETNDLFKKVTGITYINNKENLGFARASNQGAKVARGKYLLFANNDIIVTPGWLPNLIETIENYPQCGVVGFKLVWPNGKLQEAGSIIWKDGTATGYGRGDDPARPEYSYLREVDYCSAACLLISKFLFDELNGWDERYSPAYYEDADLCMGVRKLGYRVIYQPEVTVFHHEYTSGGYTNAAALMQANNLKFLYKWENMLKDKLAFSPSNILNARDLRKAKKILVLDDRIPTPDQGTGYPRAHQLIKSIAEFGYKVTLFPLMDTRPWQPYTQEFQQLGIEVFFGDNLDLDKFAMDRTGYYDLVLVSRPHNMERSIGIVKEHFANALLLYDAEALYSLREILKSEIKGTKLEEIDAKSMIDAEIKLMKQADIIVTVSENERATALKYGVKQAVSWGHPTNIIVPAAGFEERKDILFIGAFLSDDSPNEDAVLHFTKSIFPHIYERMPCRFIVVGKNPPASIKELASANVIVAGYVADLTEYYEKCRVFVVPHRYSGGIAWKLTEAMSRGIPSVVSKLTAAQLNLTDGAETLTANSEEEFAQKVIQLYQDGQLWQRIQKNAFSYIAETCDPARLNLTLKNILEMAIKSNDPN